MPLRERLEIALAGLLSADSEPDENHRYADEIVAVIQDIPNLTHHDIWNVVDMVCDALELPEVETTTVDSD